MDAHLPQLWAVHRKTRGDCALALLEVRMEEFRMRRRHSAPCEEFDNDRTDRATILGALIVLGLLIGGLWWLGR